ncbi:MAG: ribonuclease P protein component [Candidatus Coatesbacteria bacterium]|nr:MAG: ribonuclease P protein component [Candidatus Coatesbacteria bacterium]
MAGDQSRRFRFPRAARLRRRRDFARVFRAGRAASRPEFVLHALAVPGEGRRLGVVCGRRVGTAVVRNRLRRRLREIFRTRPEVFRDGCWFVVVARPPLAAWDYRTLEREVLAAAAEIAGGADEEAR